MTMRYPDNMPVITSGQERIIALYGETIWCDLCDAMPLDTWFKPNDLVGKLHVIRGLAHATQLNYIRVVLTAVRLDIEQRPEEYDGSIPLRFRGGRTITGYAL